MRARVRTNRVANKNDAFEERFIKLRRVAGRENPRKTETICGLVAPPSTIASTEPRMDRSAGRRDARLGFRDVRRLE